MSLAFERTLVSEDGGLRPARPESSLNVTVIFTTVEATLAALREAGRLADRLDGHITLIATQLVPYPLPLSSPPVLLDWAERRFVTLAGASRVQTVVRLYLCRDRLETLRKVLQPKSLVVLGGHRRWWWPTAEQNMARQLSRAQHEVLFTETE